ncbi:MAG: hypothetical protein KBB77_01910 [Candidatus Moranbacteria bacterium]|nr:hypothetical protein [Candidatus Moranbacteria bacterium]
MLQNLFLIFGLVILAWELKLNWQVAKVLLPSFYELDSLSPKQWAIHKSKIHKSMAAGWFTVSTVKGQMITPFGIAFVAVLTWTCIGFPFSWKAVTFFALTIAHFVLLWVARNHDKIVEIHVRKLPPEEQSEVFRLFAEIRAAMLKQKGH